MLFSTPSKYFRATPSSRAPKPHSRCYSTQPTTRFDQTQLWQGPPTNLWKETEPVQTINPQNSTRKHKTPTVTLNLNTTSVQPQTPYLTELVIVMWKWSMECESNEAGPKHTRTVKLKQRLPFITLRENYKQKWSFDPKQLCIKKKKETRAEHLLEQSNLPERKRSRLSPF